MNREILFRGKRIDNGEWVYGYLWSSRTIGCESLCGNIDEIVVDPSTVGQYTGLTDKNVVKIFEGDICKIGNLIYQVAFKYSRWELDIIPDKVYCNPYFNSHCGELCEVIGNIYDGKDGHHDEL